MHLVCVVGVADNFHLSEPEGLGTNTEIEDTGWPKKRGKSWFAINTNCRFINFHWRFIALANIRSWATHHSYGSAAFHLEFFVNNKIQFFLLFYNDGENLFHFTHILHKMKYFISNILFFDYYNTFHFSELFSWRYFSNLLLSIECQTWHHILYTFF